MSAPTKSPLRLTAADWDHWFAVGHPQVVTAKEADHVHRTVRPRPGLAAADLGCGSGQWTRQLAAWGLDVTGYDYSTEALRQATAAGLSGTLSFVRWDVNAEAIPPRLRPGSLDLVTCRYVFPYLEHGRLLTDVGRWLKPDGIFYALVHVRADPRDIDGEPAEEAGPYGMDVFHRGLTESQVRAFGPGWAHHEVHRLTPHRCAIVLRGYDSALPTRQGGSNGGLQTPGAGGDAPSPESRAPAPGPYDRRTTTRQGAMK